MGVDHAARGLATPDAAERVAQVVMQEARMQESYMSGDEKDDH